MEKKKGSGAKSATRPINETRYRDRSLWGPALEGPFLLFQDKLLHYAFRVQCFKADDKMNKNSPGGVTL